jgi:WD40 repeat protein/tRNA A-37 threonylcarbamoyl transferase component Bud32
MSARGDERRSDSAPEESEGEAAEASRTWDVSRTWDEKQPRGLVSQPLLLSDRPWADLVVPLGVDLSSSAPPQQVVILHHTLEVERVTDEHAGRYHASEASGRSELGRGGIGRVFVALDQHLRREVAVKELLSVEDADPIAAATTTARFLREARITGQLDHPNIVPVYELGRRADGSLYYTMRVVRGRTLSRAIAEANELSDRLALMGHFLGLCQAIAYAHSRGIVHRDIKPENVMIGEFGETVVLDWGMAKNARGRGALDIAHDSSSLPEQLTSANVTLEGTLCGTPNYMSPEQALGRVGEVDERSDVWSLGAVLYTLLTGKTPFAGTQPLHVIANVLACSYEPARKCDARIPPELDAIIGHSLCRDPNERYANAKELAREIQAFQVGARVGAYAYSSLDLLRRFVERHRGAVVAAAVGLVALVALAVVSYGRVVAARDRALLAERNAVGNARAARASEREARHSSADVLTERAAPRLLEGDASGAAMLAARALELEERPDARGLFLTARSLPSPMLERAVPGLAGCERSALSFATERLACVRGGSVEILGLAGDLVTRIPAAEVVALTFSDDGLALAVAERDGKLSVHTPSSGAQAVITTFAAPTALALSPDGRRLAVGNARGAVRIFGAGAAELAPKLAQGVSSLAFDRRAQRLAVGGELGGVTLLGADGKRVELLGHSGTVRALAFSEDGRHLASGGADRSVRIWDLAQEKAAGVPLLNEDTVTTVSFSRDGRFLALGSKDRSYSVHELRGASRRVRVRRADETAELVVASPELDRIATLDREHGLKLWSLASLRQATRLFERGNVLSLAFVVGEKELAAAGLGANGVCLWAFADGSCTTRLPTSLKQVRGVAVSPDGRRLAVAGSDRRVLLWDLPQRMPIGELAGDGDEQRAVAFSADGRFLAWGGLSGTLSVVRAEAGDAVATLPVGAGVQALGVGRDFAPLVSGDRNGNVTLWDLQTRRKLSQWRASERWLLAVAVTEDGSRIASAAEDGVVKIWDTKQRKLLHTLSGHRGKVFALDFAKKGALLASAGEDRSIRLWDAYAGKALAILGGHEGPVRSVRFAEGGARLASASDDGTIRLFRLTELAVPGPELLARLR